MSHPTGRSSSPADAVGDQAIQRVQDGSVKRPTDYIPGLDGLRAISIALVVLAHIGYGEIVPGGLGVNIFFFISGLLITRLLLLEQQRHGGISLLNFYLRRILRLAPELLIFVALVGFIGPRVGLIPVRGEIACNALYFANYCSILGLIEPNVPPLPWTQLWSLAVEEHYYLIYPAVFLITARPRWVMSAIVALIMVPLCWRLYGYYIYGLPEQHIYIATDTRIDSIAWGCLLAACWRRADPDMRVDDKRIAGTGPFWLFLGLLLMGASLVLRDDAFRWTFRFTVQGLSLYMMVGTLLSWRPGHRILGLLELPPIRFLGRISYAIYLYHLVAFLAAAWLFGVGSRTFAISGLGLSIGAGLLSYLTVERPLLPLRRRLRRLRRLRRFAG